MEHPQQEASHRGAPAYPTGDLLMSREKRADVKRLRARGHAGPIYDVDEAVPPSARHPGRTKGTPFSRVEVVNVTKGERGAPATFTYKRHTRRPRTRTIRATRENVGLFMGQNLPFHWVSELLGGLA